ncbi:hypothetical protein TNCV_2838161 [Trichonephila clavipes]|nr:hypothetical protein TNCV_2838161 [Trichonephila clavipes]
MSYNLTTWPLSIFYITKIHQIGLGSNPHPWVQMAGNKSTTPPSRRNSRSCGPHNFERPELQGRHFRRYPTNFHIIST